MAKQEFTDAIALLKHDHDEVEALFDKFEKTSNTDKQWEIAQTICTELKIHTIIEEEIFYPATRDAVEEDLYKEAFIEHDAAKVLINDILANGPEDEFFESKVHVLSEEIEHHVEEEEKRSEGYFAQVRQNSNVDLVELRDRMLARKQELKAQAEDGGLPPAETVAVEAQEA